MKKILCVASHPDDETLGCGGTLLKHVKQGDEIYWLIMTNISEDEGFDKQVVETRQKEIEKVSEKFGFKKTFKLNFPTTRLDQVARNDLVGKTRDVIEEVAPDLIYVPGKNDSHSDHRVTFETILSNTKSFRNDSIRKVLMYETISETEFSPQMQETVFVPNNLSDISEELDDKLSIMKTYESEMGQHPFPRSEQNIKALATFRGAMAGVQYAEAFNVVKEIW